MSKLQSATVRRGDAKHRHELLLKAIHSNAMKERSITNDISKIRSDIVSNKQDLMAAQQIESQTRLRVETIVHKTELEQTRHAETVANLDSKSKGRDESKVNIAQTIEDKKAALEGKKAELRAIWKKRPVLRKSEGHPEPDGPVWGTEQPPSLDVTRVRVSANTEKAELDATKTQREALRQDVSDLDGLVASNVAKSVEKGAEAEGVCLCFRCKK